MAILARARRFEEPDGLVARRGPGDAPPSVATAERVLALLEVAFTTPQRIEPLAELGFRGVGSSFALGEAALVRKEALLLRLEILRPAAEHVVLLTKLVLPRRDSRFASRKVGLRQQPSVVGFLEPFHALVQLARVLLSGCELLPGLGADLAQCRLGPVELANQVIDPRLAADVVGAELG
jgi:hypothetical protein